MISTSRNWLCWFLILAVPSSVVAADEVIEKGLKAAQAAITQKNDKKAIEILDRVIDEIAKDKKVRLEEETSPLYHLRGHAHLRLKQEEKALDDFRAALKLEPDNVDYLNNAAWLQATSPVEKVRDGKIAVELAKRAVKLVKANRDLSDAQQAYILAEYLDTLAAAHAEAGDFKPAVRSQQEALDNWVAFTNISDGEGLKFFFGMLAFSTMREEAVRSGKGPTDDEVKEAEKQVEQAVKNWLEKRPQFKARLESYRESKPYREKR